MKRNRTLLAAAIAAISVSCSKEAAEPQAQQGEINFVSLQICAAREVCDDTKAYVSDWTSGTQFWASDDHIAVWANGTKCDFANKKGADGPSALFEGEVPESSSPACALYPFSAATSAKGLTITATMPHVQIPDSRGTDPKALIAAASPDDAGYYNFKNAFGLVMITVPQGVEDIKSITIEGNNNESITGEMNITLDGTGNVTVEPTSQSLKYVTLAPSKGTLAPGTYAVAIIPTSFSSGLNFIVKRDSGAKAAIRHTTASYKVFRNMAANFDDTVLSGLSDADYRYYYIFTKEDLDEWNNDYVNWGADDKVYLAADINYEKATWSKKNKQFTGVFDGRYHNIYNISASGSNARAGFLHEVSGTVKNVCFGSSDYDFSKGSAADAGTGDGYSRFYVSGCSSADAWYYAGLICCLQENGVLDNVVNFCSVYSAVYNGSSSNLKASYHRVGGIAGTMMANTTIQNCVNYGEVYNHGTIGAGTTNDVGGIVSRSDGDGAVVKNCVNRGEVSNSSPYVYRVGGIIGTAGYAMTLDNCQNYGNVTTSADVSNTIYVGGIIGGCSVQLTGRTKFRNEGVITNLGNITKSSKNIYLGGIIGHHISVSHSLPGAVNTGDIINTGDATGDIRMGGIMGYTYAASTFSDVVNTGNLKNSGSATNLMMGGILGYSTSADKVSAENVCVLVNSGKISGTASIGGLVGNCTVGNVLSSSTSDCTISNTASSGAVTGLLIGKSTSNPSATLCGVRGSNKGKALTSNNWASNLYGSVTDPSGIVVDGGASSCYFLDTPYTETAKIKVGTYNIYSPGTRKNDDMGPGRRWSSAVEGLALTIVSMDCDIIGMNELRDSVWNHPNLTSKQQLRARVDALNGNRYTWKWKYPNYSDGRSSFCNGFAYDATKLELLSEPVREWLSNTETTISSSAINGGRTIVYAKFRHIESGKIFWFASTHLQLGSDYGDSWYNASCCVNLALKKVNHNETCFLVGDMNSASVSTRPHTIAKLMEYWDDAYESAKANSVLDASNLAQPATRPGSSKVGTGTDAEISSLSEEKYRFDHIMFDKAKVTGYNCVRDFYKGCDGVMYWPSDHFPIWATFEF